MKASKGFNTGRTRSLKKGRMKKLGITSMFARYKVGDEVTLLMTSGFSGMPHGRYRGRKGEIVALRGNAYVIKINDMGMEKEFIVPGVHLRK